MLGVAVGGAVFGFLTKSFPGLPSIPVLGRSGTIALGCYLLRNMGGGANGIIRDTGLAAAAIAGFTFGNTGAIMGNVDVHGIASQV